ncbi:hypothetical protein STASHLEY_00850 [Brevundimonas phage vB_BpoS-StAshley]|nr:hypothetical protein STASHLEY_00850 [Brevundimonas phage vB_BpoS-StAshley]UTC30052.1 hypothetical protein MAINES_00130 [Brevundimonas phage vB_BpoS-MaInes]
MKLFKKPKSLEDIKEQKEALENPNFSISPKGAFKTRKRKPGQNLKGGAMPDIFKLQRPLFTAEAEPKVLVYNESRTWEGLIPLTPALMELFGEEFKVYITAIPSDTGQLTPLNVITGQDW